MSTTSDSYDTENRESAVFEAIEDEERETDGASCTYWVRDDGREFITDPNGDVVNLARLTAYAEHGDDIFGAEAHHKVPPLKIDAPAFVEPLTREEHGRLHGRNLNPVEVDDIPMLQPEA